MERIQAGIQFLLDQIAEYARLLLEQSEIKEINKKFLQEQLHINSALNAIFSEKNGSILVKNPGESFVIEHLDDIVQFIKNYHKTFRRIVLGFPALNLEDLTAAFKDELDEIGFYKKFKD